MKDAESLRNKLHETLNTYGMTLMFISRSLNWKYHNLNKFKNGHIDMSEKRREILNEFLQKYDTAKKKVVIH